MKILLDECVDERLAGDFAGHEVLTVRQMGWKGKQNGQLSHWLQSTSKLLLPQIAIFRFNRI